MDPMTTPAPAEAVAALAEALRAYHGQSRVAGSDGAMHEPAWDVWASDLLARLPAGWSLTFVTVQRVAVERWRAIEKAATAYIEDDTVSNWDALARAVGDPEPVAEWLAYGDCSEIRCGHTASEHGPDGCVLCPCTAWIAIQPEEAPK